MRKRERLVLEYLSPLMEATPRMIGEHIIKIGESTSKHPSSVGSVTCQDLHEQGLVTYLSDLKAWRITAEGREALAK